MNTAHHLKSTVTENHKSEYNYRKNRGELFPVPKGKIQARNLSGDENQTYYLYIPLSCRSNAPVFISVHGIKRRAKDHVRHFAPFAERYGCIVIAPYFPEKRFNGYQYLGINGKGERADWILDNIIAEVVTLTGANSNKLYMFGYSGGAQFVSRYTMLYPHRVARIALAAPGWYTFPDPLLDYPLGIKRIQGHSELGFDLMKILSIPTCVLVGEKDTLRDKHLRKSRNIDQQQGINRLERSKRWVKFMLASARANNLKTQYDFRMLPDSGHSFMECMQNGAMGSHVFTFLFDLSCGSNHFNFSPN